MDEYIKAGGEVEGATGPGTQPPGSPKQPCIEYKVEAKWLDTEAYCGDEVKLEATVTPAPPDGPATIDLLRPPAAAGGLPQSAAPTINTNIVGGKIQFTWVAKAPSADWRNVTIQFRANVPTAGVSGLSGNTFKFKQRPTTAWILLNIAHASGGGFAPCHEKHDASLEADRVHYSLKLRTFGQAFDATKQSATKTQVEDAWNGGFTGKKFHRTKCKRGRTCDCPYDCCKADFRIDVNFVASGEHVAIKMIPGVTASGTNGDGAEWSDPPRWTYTYAHEVGHLLGQADEYPAGATDPTGVQPAPPPAAEGKNLMSEPSTTKLLNRHYRWVLKFLNDHAAGDPYEIVPP
jgi:hypothetical protein